MIDFTLKIGGEAGFGIMTTGLLMGKIATRSREGKDLGQMTPEELTDKMTKEIENKS